MGLDKGAALAVVAAPANDADLTLTGIGRGGRSTELVFKPAQREAWQHRRARKGTALAQKIRPTGAK